MYPGRRLHHTRLWPSSTQLLPFLFHRISSSSPPHPPPPPPPKKSDVTRATALWRTATPARLASTHRHRSVRAPLEPSPFRFILRTRLAGSSPRDRRIRAPSPCRLTSPRPVAPLPSPAPTEASRMLSRRRRHALRPLIQFPSSAPPTPQAPQHLRRHRRPRPRPCRRRQFVRSTRRASATPASFSSIGSTALGCKSV